VTSPVCDAVIEQLPAPINVTDAVVVEPLSDPEPTVQVLVVFEVNKTNSDLSLLAEIEKFPVENDWLAG
jgi:hypothetical protein